MLRGSPAPGTRVIVMRGVKAHQTGKILRQLGMPNLSPDVDDQFEVELDGGERIMVRREELE